MFLRNTLVRKKSAVFLAAPQSNVITWLVNMHFSIFSESDVVLVNSYAFEQTVLSQLHNINSDSVILTRPVCIVSRWKLNGSMLYMK